MMEHESQTEAFIRVSESQRQVLAAMVVPPFDSKDDFQFISDFGCTHAQGYQLIEEFFGYSQDKSFEQIAPEQPAIEQFAGQQVAPGPPTFGQPALEQSALEQPAIEYMNNTALIQPAPGQPALEYTQNGSFEQPIVRQLPLEQPNIEYMNDTALIQPAPGQPPLGYTNSGAFVQPMFGQPALWQPAIEYTNGSAFEQPAPEATQSPTYVLGQHPSQGFANTYVSSTDSNAVLPGATPWSIGTTGLNQPVLNPSQEHFAAEKSRIPYHAPETVATTGFAVRKTTIAPHKQKVKPTNPPTKKRQPTSEERWMQLDPATQNRIIEERCRRTEQYPSRAARDEDLDELTSLTNPLEPNNPNWDPFAFTPEEATPEYHPTPTNAAARKKPAGKRSSSRTAHAPAKKQKGSRHRNERASAPVGQMDDSDMDELSETSGMLLYEPMAQRHVDARRYEMLARTTENHNAVQKNP